MAIAVWKLSRCLPIYRASADQLFYEVRKIVSKQLPGKTASWVSWSYLASVAIRTLACTVDAIKTAHLDNVLDNDDMEEMTDVKLHLHYT